jgi:transglutaminase-like putative cysteine protease
MERVAPRGFRVVVAAAGIAALAGLPAPRAVAGDEPSRDAWYVVKIDGQRAGHMHGAVRRVPEGIESTEETDIVLGRLGQGVRIVDSKKTVEDDAGKILSITSVGKQSDADVRTEIKFEGGKAHVTIETMGQKRAVDMPVPDEVVGPWKAERLLADGGYKAGTSADVKVFSAELGGAVDYHEEVVGPEEIDVPGEGKKTLTRTDTKMSIQTVSSWLDASGIPVRIHISAGGLELDAFRTTKEKALAKDDDAAAPTSPEILIQSLAVVKNLVPHCRNTDTALLRLRPRRKVEFPDLADERQAVEGKDADGSLRVRIRKVVPGPTDVGTRPLADPPDDLKPFLAASSKVQSDDPLLIKTANEAVKDEKDAWHAAQAIERWVDKNLTQKDMGVGFASALEVCRDRRGDCTEHAVLVAGLCRAAGIPSRVCMGLEYVQGIFGGHAWTEVNVAGKWFALDATNGRGFVDALHLTVVKTSLADATGVADLVHVGDVVGAVDVEVLETTWNGRTFHPTADDAVTVVGSRYVNRLYDLAFEAPAGSTVQAVTPKGIESRLATLGGSAGGEPVQATVAVDDLPPSFDRAALAQKGVPGWSLAGEVPVDGRPGLLFDSKEGDARMLVVQSEDVLIRIAWKPFPAGTSPEENRQQKPFGLLVASVELDPVSPPKGATPPR